MINESKVLKIITPHLCPHCSKPIVISSGMTAPWIDWVLKNESIEKSKQSIIDTVKASTIITPKEKKPWLEWLNKETTLFGPDEVDSILKQILSKAEEKKL